MPFLSLDRSKRQATVAHPMQRRHVAGLVAVGAVVASSAFALPVLAQGDDAPTADASATVPTGVATTSIPTTTVVPSTTTSTTAAPAPAPDPTAVFAATVAGLTPEQQLAFTIYTATPEARAAFFTFISPPPPPPAPEPTPAPEPDLAPAPVAAPPAPGGFLACVRQRESKGNYSINTGNGYFGAYQFSQTTWNNTARHAGRGDLVGVRPSSVSPADQDAMAQSLLAWQGRSPWAGPGC